MSLLHVALHILPWFIDLINKHGNNPQWVAQVKSGCGQGGKGGRVWCLLPAGALSCV